MRLQSLCPPLRMSRSRLLAFQGTALVLLLQSCDALSLGWQQSRSSMRAAQANAFGDVKEILSVKSNCSRPSVQSGSGKILVRVRACSLSPSDYRTITGDCDIVKKPAAFPYIPGGDICGVVEEVDKGEKTFKKGDIVVATWSLFGEGGLAEFALVDPKLAALKPPSISILEGAALANSASYAEYWARAAKLKTTDRVLVIGGSGGIGTILVQLIRNAGVAHLACTSTDHKLMKRLGADRVIDYRTERWWEKEDNCEPYDVIFDCAVGRQAWDMACDSGVLRSGWQGGRFVAFVLNDWQIEGHTWSSIFGLLIPPLLRQIYSRCCPFFLPKYKMVLGPDINGASIARVLTLVDQRRIRPVLDPASPFRFTTSGVRRAFALHMSRRAKGKVVVSVS